jgi:hypothetical protein
MTRSITLESPKHILVEESPLCRIISHTRLSRDYVSAKTSLDNYEGLTDPREHI